VTGENVPTSKRCDASPTPIAGEEHVAYGLYSPLFDPANPRLTPEAIQIDQLLGPRGGHLDKCGYSTGLSVCRLGFAGARDELRRALEGIVVAKPGRRIEGFARVRVQQIWNIVAPQTGTSSFKVLDDGRQDYQTHAVIRGADGLGRSALRGPRADLIELLNAGVTRHGP